MRLRLGRISHATPMRVRISIGKGNEQPAKEAQKALGALAGIVALYRHTHLYDAPAQNDDANGPNAGEK